MGELCLYLCFYLSDGLWDPVAAAGVCEAYSCVHADLVANRHVHRLRAFVRASQSLDTKKKRLKSLSHFSLFVIVIVIHILLSLTFSRVGVL